MRRSALWGVVLVLAWAAAQADGGFFERVYRGLELAATPSGFPLQSTGDGARVNGERLGRLRIVPNRAGRGYSLEMDRSFGFDARGRPEILDLGIGELELRGATQSTFEFTNRLMLIGTGQINIQNLTYSLRLRDGLQDAELRGTLTAVGRLEVNQLGFYTLNLDVSNTNSQLLLDGVIARDQQDANFDVGPINVKGNIILDAIIASLGATGLDTTALEQLTPGSPVGLLADQLRERIQTAPLVAGTRVVNDGQLPPIPPRLLDGLAADSSALRELPVEPNPTGAVPEPGALILLAGGGLLLGLRRR